MDGSIQTRNALPAAGLFKNDPSALKDAELDPLRVNKRGELRVTAADEIRALRVILEEMVAEQRKTNKLLARLR